MAIIIPFRDITKDPGIPRLRPVCQTAFESLGTIGKMDGLEMVQGSLKGPISNRTFEVVIALYDSNINKVDFQNDLSLRMPASELASDWTKKFENW